MTIRVAVADDQAIIRSGLRVQISLAPDLEFVGEASNGEQAVAVARQQRPDVLLMDVRMPVLDGIDATWRIASEEATQAVRVIVLTTFDLDDYVYRALRAGASGFLLKDTSPEQLLAAIRVVSDGGALLDPQLTRRLIAEFAARPATSGTTNSRIAELLTAREIEVLGLVGRGLTNTEIADRLVVSIFTAKTHVSRILTKLGARDRSQLVIAAYESGLVVPGSDPS
jgi:DNA-binding NarL/FixJ family response regulator